MSTIQLVFERITTVPLVDNLLTTIRMINNIITPIYIYQAMSPNAYITLDGFQMVTLSGEEMIYA